MKHFIFSTTEEKKKYYREITFTVYQVKKNVPTQIGTFTVNTGSWSGYEQEVYLFLQKQKGMISKKFAKENKKYWYGMQTNNQLSITGV